MFSANKRSGIKKVLDLRLHSNVKIRAQEETAMIKNSISETSKELKISKDALRYYDSMGLVRPHREENKYRYYREEDIVDLKYIEVMKYVGFSLKEIKTVLDHKRRCTSGDMSDTLSLLNKKQIEIQQKIELYQQIQKLITEAVNLLDDKTCDRESEEVNDLIQMVFDHMKGKSDEK